MESVQSSPKKGIKAYFEHNPIQAIFLVIFLDFLAIGLTIPILPPLFKDVDRSIFPRDFTQESREIYYMVLSGLFFVGTFIGAPILGSLSDRFGRVKLLIVTATFSFFGFLIVALGIIFKMVSLIFIGRILGGALGAILVIVNSCLADVSQSNSKAKNFGVTGVAFGLGFSTGPILGGILSEPSIVSWFSYEIPYILACVLILFNLLFIVFAFPETFAQKLKVKVSLLSGPRNVQKAFQNPSLRVIFLVIFILSMGFSLYVQFFIIYLINKFGFENQVHMGIALLWVGISVAFAQGVVLRLLSKRFQPQQILKFSIPAMAVTFVLLTLPENYIYFFILVSVMAIAQGLTFPNCLAIVSNQVSEDIQGEIIGINQSVQALASTAPLFFAAAAAYYTDFPMLYGSLCACVAYGIFFLVYLRKYRAGLVE